jgi:glycosyltransferase involved in cell wall biosynthesis
VLFVYGDHVGERMGGVGIRALELARAVRDQLSAEVTIAAASSDNVDLGVPVVVYEPHAPRSLANLLDGADAVVAQPGWPLLMRRLARSRARLVFDLYDPEVFGTLENLKHRSAATRALMSAYAVDRVCAALRTGHHVMCASERQRDLWLGAILGAGLLSPAPWERDSSLRSLLEVVPYGIPAEPPVAVDPAALRARLGLSAEEELVLWNGGLWSWFDASSAIRAVGLLRERRPGVRLVFMGAGSRAEPALRATEQARTLARELGLLDQAVIFNEEWVAYEQRADWLLGADCAISTHLDHLETRFAYRTRLLDCLWAGLPIVCTTGDELASRVEREDLGALAAPGDPVAIASAIERVLDAGRESYRERLAAAAAAQTWERVAEPLLSWLSGPAPDVPLGHGRGLERRPSERLRSAAYLLAAGVSSTLRVRPPALH